MSDIRMAEGGSRPDDGREPFCRDGIEIDPSTNVLRWEAQRGSQGGDTQSVNDRCKEHSDRLHETCNMANGEDGPASALEARRRLKALRQDAGMTPEDLAAKIRRSPSSVRAHENGQNGISRKAATLYAQTFGVSPSFILWGDNRPEEVAPPGVRLIPIVGVLSGQTWSDRVVEKDRGHIPLDAGAYDDFDLEAYLIGSASTPYRKGDWVVVAPAEVGVRSGDHVAIQIKDGMGRIKLNLYEVDRGAAGLTFRSVLGGPDRVGVRATWNSRTALDEKTATLLGPVIAYGGRSRPDGGALIRNDSFTTLNVLG